MIQENEEMVNLNLAGVYRFRNLINGHEYIGSSQNMRVRRNLHLSDFRLNRRPNSPLSRAWTKYGSDALIFEILITCDPSMCLWYEQQFLDQWRPHYNLNPEARSPRGVKHTLESRRHMSESAKRRTNKRRLGYKASLETRAKQRESAIRRGVRPPSRKGTTFKHTEETKRKISEAAKRDPNRKAQLDAARKLCWNRGEYETTVAAEDNAALGADELRERDLSD